MPRAGARSTLVREQTWVAVARAGQASLWVSGRPAGQNTGLTRHFGIEHACVLFPFMPELTPMASNRARNPELVNWQDTDEGSFKNLPVDSIPKYVFKDGVIQPLYGEGALERKARLFAHDAHAGIFRKYTSEPYIVHPHNVAAIVRCVVHSEEQLAAAWLHDVVEDCGVAQSTITSLFGEHVSSMVHRLTHQLTKAEGNRAFRMAHERMRLGGALKDTQTVKLADLIDNSSTIIPYDRGFAFKTYLPEMRALLNVLKAGDTHLWNAADKICRAAGL